MPQSAAVRAAHEDDLPLLRQEGNPRSHDFNSATGPAGLADPVYRAERRGNEGGEHHRMDSPDGKVAPCR